MSLSAEEKTLFFDLQSALTKIATRFSGEEGVFPTLDEACRDWLHYRAGTRAEPDVAELEISVRVDNAFHNAGVQTVAQVRALTDEDYEQMGLSKMNVKHTRRALADWDAKQVKKGGPR